jgi:hypothetical protein
MVGLARERVSWDEGQRLNALLSWLGLDVSDTRST